VGKYALGIKLGFLRSWWTWLYTFVDLAIYPVLFVQYASFFFPDWMLIKFNLFGDQSGRRLG